MTWKVLDMVCPGAYKEKGCSKQERQNWFCVTHRNKLFINENGTIECNNSACCSNHLTKWGFSCHFHPGTFVQFNSAFEFRAAITDMVMFMDDAEFHWVKRLKDVIKESFPSA